MLLNLLLLAAGLMVLTLGAESLVRGSATLALRLGITPLVVGLTVVAFGTSAPELVVSVQAALAGQDDIAAANVVGSNIFNIGVILGLTALLLPLTVHRDILRRDLPLVILVSLATLWLLQDRELGRLAGLGLVSVLAGYLVLSVRQTRQAPGEPAQADAAIRGSVVRDVLYILVGLALLVIGSRLMVAAAITLARVLGVGEAIIGLTIVAAGTSLPELATSLAAALRRQPDLAVGNVVGSNLFNLLGILGIATLVSPLAPGALRWLDLGAMALFALALLPLLISGRQLQRWEGALLLAGYGVYLALCWPR